MGNFWLDHDVVVQEDVRLIKRRRNNGCETGLELSIGGVKSQIYWFSQTAIMHEDFEEVFFKVFLPQMEMEIEQAAELQ